MPINGFEISDNFFNVFTKGLIKSFGWGSDEKFEQHDIQKFCQKLLDAIEKTLQNTEYDSILSQLFEGEMISYIRGCKPNTNTYKIEKFQDIQLNVPRSDINFSRSNTYNLYTQTFNHYYLI